MEADRPVEVAAAVAAVEVVAAVEARRVHPTRLLVRLSRHVLGFIIRSGLNCLFFADGCKRDSLNGGPVCVLIACTSRCSCHVVVATLTHSDTTERDTNS